MTISIENITATLPASHLVSEAANRFDVRLVFKLWTSK
jgi:hypothetical protein